MKKGLQRGMTLLEVMIAIAIMVLMMTLAWTTIRNTNDARRTFEGFEERNQELRAAMARMVNDFESAYISKNEDVTQAHPRTMMIVKSSEPVPSVRFSTFNHRVLWSDAKESEQTVIEYLPHVNKDTGKLDLIRREQRRESNQPPELEPSEYDILVSDIVALKVECWNWKTVEWFDHWDTTQSDGQRGTLPYRVRITITTKGADGKDVTLTTEARILMQEALNFSPT